VSVTDILAALIYGAVGVLHLLPGLALFAPRMLARLYGGAADGPVLLMLQHRAALLGLVGGLLLAAAFLPAWRAPAAIAGVVSMATYLWLYLRAPAASRAPLRGIAIADGLALPALLAAVWLSPPSF
jgi:hypothetical protein